MQIASLDRDGTLVLEIVGRLDADTTPEFDRACREAITDESSSIVLDCAGLEYISSAGLRSVLSLAKESSARDRGLSVCRLTGLVREVFDISGFAHMMPVYGTLEEALAAA